MLSVFFGALVGFACGAILGIVDCKKTYGIPKNAKPEDGIFALYDDLVTPGTEETDDYGNILDY